MEKPLGCLKDDNPRAQLPVTGQRRDEAGDGRQVCRGLNVSGRSLGFIFKH